MTRRYSQEIVDYITEHAQGTSYRAMSEQVERIFGISFTPDQAKAFYHNHHLKNGRRGGVSRPIKFPAEMGDYIRSICLGRSSAEIADLVNARFGEGTITPRQVRTWKKNNHVRSDMRGWFQEGNIPWTAGKTWDEIMSPEAQQRSAACQFKEGHIPHNLAPVGAIRKNSDGYLIKKVQGRGANQRTRWKFLHRLIWEEAHGPVPEGSMVCFADGNRENCVLENLYLETHAQHGVRNTKHWKSYDRESAETLNLMADLAMAISKKKRRRK